MREYLVLEELYITTPNLNMKESSMIVISVTIKLHNRVILQDIFKLYMMVLSMLVISVTNNLHSRVI